MVREDGRIQGQGRRLSLVLSRLSAFRLMMNDLFERLWFFFGERPQIDPKREIASELKLEERQESPIVALAREKKKPANDGTVWEPSPLFDFRWSL